MGGGEVSIFFLFLLSLGSKVTQVATFITSPFEPFYTLVSL